jgi:hypothetical protein
MNKQVFCKIPPLGGVRLPVRKGREGFSRHAKFAKPLPTPSQGRESRRAMLLCRGTLHTLSCNHPQDSILQQDVNIL